MFLLLQLIKKLNRHERVVEEVKIVLKPHYMKKHISREDYKEIMKRSIPKVSFYAVGEDPSGHVLITVLIGRSMS